MENETCSDTGPILHLYEVNQISLLNLFSKIFISSCIKEELLRHKIERLPKNVELQNINKDQVALLSERYSLDDGEASVIWMCKSFNIPILLTDDLNAREVAKSLDITSVGTIGIIIRNFREKKISREDAARALKDIFDNSSLFITSQLINNAIDEIKKFKQR